MAHRGRSARTVGVMSDRYRILEKIGEGGIGAIYRAHDTQLDREVAIKRMFVGGDDKPEETVAALMEEAKILSALKHPHIVTVHDVGTDEQGPFIVMELLEGETLDEIVERGALELDDFKRLAVQALEGLVAAEAEGLLHRDLKPANIMLVWLPSGKFQVKILDFGLAGFSKTPAIQTMDHSGSILGSVYFMAPEQFERQPLDARTDLYSIGAIFYYALTGSYAFAGETPGRVMEAHLAHRFLPLAEYRPDLPSAVCAWVERLFARRMDDRPVDARAALESFSVDPAIDEAQLREASSSDPGVAAELVDSFIEEAQDFLMRMEVALKAGDGVTAVDLARHLRGTAATLGYAEILSIAERIEKEAVADPAGSLVVFAGFGPALERLREAVSELVWKVDDEGTDREVERT